MALYSLSCYNNNSNNHICIILLLFLVSFSMFYSPVFGRKQLHSHDHARGELYEEKSRLGSTPPSCYNKCNQCHPCTAVQVPTIPSLNRVVHHPLPPGSVPGFEYNSALWDNNRYTNYKPLGWKCSCKNHFYNP